MNRKPGQSDRTAYAHPLYAQSFSQQYELVHLPLSETTFLKRNLDDGYYDLTGMYPFVSIQSGAAFLEDLHKLRDQTAVSIVFVTDPFTGPEQLEKLKSLHVFTPFKKHYISDLSRDWQSYIRPRYRNAIRKAQNTLQTRILEATPDYAPTFWELYQHLIQRHHIEGIQRFSQDIIARQLAIPNTFIIEARYEDELLGATISYLSEASSYMHLHAQTEAAYKMEAGYGLFAATLEYLTGKTRYLSIGGAPGLSDETGKGLGWYKKGWSSHTLQTYLCGMVLNRDRYDHLTEKTQSRNSTYFPAYRDPHLTLPMHSINY